MKAVIMVGGPSTDSWFRPLSLIQPKPLFPIAGHSMIYHHVKSLARFDNLVEVLLIGFYEAGEFEPFIRSIADEFGVRVRYLQEPKSLGTGGGLIHFKDDILAHDPKYVFVLYGDICCSFPLGRMLVAQHQAPGTLATILATHVTREQSCNYGCLVKEDGDSQFVLHYVEKPETFVSTLVSCGVYLLDSEIFTEFDVLVARSRRTHHSEHLPILNANGSPRPSILRLEQDILSPLAADRKVSYYETKDFWCQVKTPNSAITANRLYLEEALFRRPDQFLPHEQFEAVGAVYVHPTARVALDAKLGPNVSIGPNCVVESGVRIKESIVLDGSEIRANALVVNSIIGWNSNIGAWSRIEGAPDGTTTDAITLNGVKMPSITVLGGTVNVADEQVIRNCIVLPQKDLHKSYQNEILL
jgi:mannose-1-phosphate guanylyltransferase